MSPSNTPTTTTAYLCDLMRRRHEDGSEPGYRVPYSRKESNE